VRKGTIRGKCTYFPEKHGAMDQKLKITSVSIPKKVSYNHHPENKQN